MAALQQVAHRVVRIARQQRNPGTGRVERLAGHRRARPLHQGEGLRDAGPRDRAPARRDHGGRFHPVPPPPPGEGDQHSPSHRAADLRTGRVGRARGPAQHLRGGPAGDLDECRVAGGQPLREQRRSVQQAQHAVGPLRRPLRQHEHHPGVPPGDAPDQPQPRFARRQRGQARPEPGPVRPQQNGPVLEGPAGARQCRAHLGGGPAGGLVQVVRSRAACARSAASVRPESTHGTVVPQAGPGPVCSGSASSRTRCALVPLTPKDDTPARRGRPVAGHSRASVSSSTAPASQSTCGLAPSRCSVRGSTP